ncbi:MAG: tetratricopeptide repeat protein [Pseudomonadota bacterium]
MYRLKRVVCACMAWFGFAWSASAQGPVDASPAQAREYDAAFEEMLRQPANLDVLFKFATIATRTGDYEGAVSALERMLLINPDLPRVRLELGVLYFRLGSYEIARTYLETALASQALSPEVRSRADQFMAEIQKRQSPSRLLGEVFAGVRYQSNANLGPPTSSVRLFGQAANLNQSAVGTADWGVVGSAMVRHIYDLQTQDRAQIETQLTAYANRQFQVSTANVSILDLTSGPRFQVFQGIFEDVTLKPFATLGYIWINDTPFYGSAGAGLESGVLITDKLRNTSNFVWRRQMHPNTWYVPTNDQFNGVEFSANTTFQYQLTEVVAVFSNGAIQRYQTNSTPWQNYQLYGVGGGMQFRFVDPLFKSGLPWNIGLSVNLQWWTYDQADVVIDPWVVRMQNDTILNIALAVPFDERTTLTISGGRFVRSANLPNYNFVNNSTLVGVSWRF